MPRDTEKNRGENEGEVFVQDGKKSAEMSSGRASMLTLS